MPTNLTKPHGDTVAYSAVCIHLEAVDTLMDLYGKGFALMSKKKPIPGGLMDAINAAKDEVEKTHQRHLEAKTWALQEQANG